MVTCGICRAELKIVTNTHLRLHNLTNKQYNDLFPRRRDLGHPNYFSRIYLGDRYDEVNKRRIEKLKRSLSKPECKELLRQSVRKSHETRRKMPHYGLSEEYVKILTERLLLYNSQNKPWMLGLTKETDERVARLGEHNRILKIGKPNFNPDGWGKCGIRQDLKRYFRSKWEANFARLCNYLGIEWEYEPCRFIFDRCSYLPDFYLPVCDLWVEVKGRLTDNARLRLAEMSKYYPNERVWLVDKYIYALLRKSYSSLIPNWEKETH